MHIGPGKGNAFPQQVIKVQLGTECWASIHLPAGRSLPLRKFRGTLLCYRLSGPQGY